MKRAARKQSRPGAALAVIRLPGYFLYSYQAVPRRRRSQRRHRRRLRTTPACCRRNGACSSPSCSSPAAAGAARRSPMPNGPNLPRKPSPPTSPTASPCSTVKANGATRTPAISPATRPRSCWSPHREPRSRAPALGGDRRLQDPLPPTIGRPHYPRLVRRVLASLPIGRNYPGQPHNPRRSVAGHCSARGSGARFGA